MPLYEMTSQAFRPIEEASFADLKVRERGDLQRLLRSQIEVLGDDLYVLTEEFGEWEDSRRRIDLLAIDKHANLVVIELKRTNDGGHMELQAIRYAAMISAMTFARAVQIHSDYLAANDQNPDEAQSRLLAFLTWDEAEEDEFASDVRILLVSEDFGKELTTAVLWLREREIDIRCVRLRPYIDSGRQLIDVQQVLPLPEAAEYQIQLREKEQEGKKVRAERHGLRRRFFEGVVAIARSKNTRHANLKPSDGGFIAAASGHRGMSFNYVIWQDMVAAELYIDRGESSVNKQIFDELLKHKLDVERRFGGPLSWERLDNKQACRVKISIETGGYKSLEAQWPGIQSEVVDAMIKLEAALLPAIEAINL